MAFLDKDTRDEIQQLLLDSAPLHSEKERREFITGALFNSSVLNEIEWSENARTFAAGLISTLDKHGEIEPGRRALWAVLDELKRTTGTDNQGQIDALYNRVNLGMPIDDDPVPRNPYKGLQAFTAKDVDYYFGRTAKVAEVLAILNSPDENGYLLPIVGPSGSGKSSLVMAGVLPKLDQNHWIVLNRLRPGENPIEALSACIASQIKGDAYTIQKNLRDDNPQEAINALCAYTQQIASGTEKRVLLFIDQFEEVFTQTTDFALRQRFIDLLVAAPECNIPLTILLTLRADFYGRPMEQDAYRDFSLMMKQYQVNMEPMSLAELQIAIEAPARKQNAWLEFQLLQAILRDLHDTKSALPLLQFVLYELYEQRDTNRRLTKQAYDAIGGLNGALTRYAQDTYDALNPTERAASRALFKRLIDPGETEQDTTRRRAYKHDLPALEGMSEVIARFVDKRLLTSDSSEHGDYLEVSHEALIREWDLLKSWLYRDRDDILFQKRLNDDARDWQERNRPPDRLYRGSQLEEALDWQTRNEASELEADFILSAKEAQEERKAEDMQIAQRIRNFQRISLAFGGFMTFSIIVAIVASIVSFDSFTQAATATIEMGQAVQRATVAANQAATRELVSNQQIATQDSIIARAETQNAIIEVTTTKVIEDLNLAINQRNDVLPENPRRDSSTSLLGLLKNIQDRGRLNCGVNDGLSGFGQIIDNEYSGFDIDICRAVATAILGDADAVEYVPLLAADRPIALQLGHVDMISRNTTNSLSRTTGWNVSFGPTVFYDGTAVIVHTSSNIEDFADIQTICLEANTTGSRNITNYSRSLGMMLEETYFDGSINAWNAFRASQCDAFSSDYSTLVTWRVNESNPENYKILDFIIPEEPLAPLSPSSDQDFANVIAWTIWGLIKAEELGITSENIDEFINSNDPTIERFLGIGSVSTGDFLGISNDFMVDVIRQVGNYGEIYDRNLGSNGLGLPRGLNALWRDGGLMFSPPFR